MTSLNSKTFSIDEVKHLKALNYLDKWKQDKSNVSDKICRGIEKVGDEEEQGTKLTTYLKPKTTLDTLPTMGEQLTRGNLKDLDLRDIYKLKKTMYLNIDMIKEYCRDVEDDERLERLLDGGVSRG